MKPISQILVLATLLLATACADDAMPPIDLRGSTTLKMLDEANGKTLLDTTDLYIDRSLRFQTSSYLIVDLGEAPGLGAPVPMTISEALAHEAPVAAGHLYQLFDPSTILRFPSGQWAILNGRFFYQLYVEALLPSENAATATPADSPLGARVKFAPVKMIAWNIYQPDGNVYHISPEGGCEQTMLSKDPELYYDKQLDNIFNINHYDDRSIIVCLENAPADTTRWHDNYSIYVRCNNIYTILNYRLD